MIIPLRHAISCGLLAIVLVLASLGAAWAQLTVPFGNPGTATTPVPLSTAYAYVRTANIYTAAELHVPAGTITSIGFYLQAVGAAGPAPIKVYLKHTQVNTFIISTVANEESGATLVYDATLPAASFVANSYVTLPLGLGAGTSTFTYDGTSNLEVIVETNAGTTNGNEPLSAKALRYTPVISANRSQIWTQVEAGPPPSGLGRAYREGRPNIALGGLGYPTDAGVQALYTLNKLGLTSGSPHVVRAVVLNNSATPQANVPVTLVVTQGATTTYTNTQVLATLPVSTTGTTVTFAGYTPPATGSYTVTVSTADGDNPTNNTRAETQVVSDAPGEFSSVDGLAVNLNRGVAPASSGSGFAVKLPTTSAVTVTAMRAQLGNATSTTAGKTVYGVVLDPRTGAILARSANYVVSQYDVSATAAPVLFKMQTPVVVGAGNLLVGLAQTYQTGQTTSYTPFGVAIEYPTRVGAYYSFSAKAAPPVDLAIADPGTPTNRLLMEAVTTPYTCLPPTNVAVGSVTTSSASLSFTTNATAPSYTITLTPAGGPTTTVSASQATSPLALSGLLPGTQYTATVSSNCGGGTTATPVSATFTTLPTVDALVQFVYTLTKLPLPVAVPHVVRAYIANFGTSTLTNLPVTLTVQGAGGFTFTDVQSIASLAPNSRELVTFAGYSPTTVGAATVTVSTNLSGDQVVSNNTRQETQVVNTTTYSYAADAQPDAYNGFVRDQGQTRAFLTKFNTNMPRSVTQMRAYLTNNGNERTSIGKTVYAVLVNPVNGTVLASSTRLVISGANINKYNTFTFTSPVTVTGDFMVGLAQTYQADQYTSYYPLGVQGQAVAQLGTSYTTSFYGPPVEASGYGYTRYMMEAVLDDPYPCGELSALTPENITSTSATVSFTGGSNNGSYVLTYTPIDGGPAQTVTATASPFSLTGLLPGTTYSLFATGICTYGVASPPTRATLSTPLPNDQCAADSPLLTCGSTVTGTTVGSTSTGDPTGTYGGIFISPASGGVFYRFVGTGQQTTISMCAGTNYDSELFVFSSACGAPPVAVASSDDACNAASSVTFMATSGTTYYVFVSGYYGARGAFTLTTSCVSLTDLVVSTAQAINGVYNNVTITSTGSATLAGNLRVAGTLTVQNGGRLAVDSYNGVYGTGRLDVQAGATLSIANNVGLINNSSNGAFFLDGTLTFSSDANYVYNGAIAQVTGPLLPARVRNLTVNSLVDVTLTNNLTVAQVVRLQYGNLLLNGKSLLLPSTAAGTALVDNTGGVVVGNTATMQRAITNAAVTAPAYRQLSSPVTRIAFDSLRTGGFVPAFNASAGYNTAASPGTVPNFPTVFGYDQSRLATAISNYGAFDKGWYAPEDGSVAMLPTQGFTVHAPVTATPFRFTGTLNTGEQRSGVLSRGTEIDAGWQLLGNPYPSPLDWSTVTDAQRPGMDAALYVAHSTGPYTTTYTSYANGIGPDSPIIEAGAAYFARVTTPGGTGAVHLTDANRVRTFGNPQAFGRNAADARPQVHLELRGSSALTDHLYVYLQAGATAGVDAEYDAVKLPNSTGLNLSAVAGATQLAIDGRPLLTAGTIVPLWLGVPTPGTFTLRAAALLNFTNAVYLYDSATGQEIDLSQQPTYTFSTSATTLAGRFALRLAPAAVLGTTPGLAAAQVAVFPNPAHAGFTVLVPAVAGASQVQAELLNSLGQVVRRHAAALSATGAHIEFDTNGLATGVYVVRLRAGDSVLTHRVTIQ